MENYVRVTDIKTTELQKPNLGPIVYQIQGTYNGAYIMSAGTMIQLHDILIKEINIFDYKCFILSKIYSLDNIKDANIYQLIKINICDKKSNCIATASFDFVPSDNSKEISTKESRTLIEGKYQSTIYFRGKQMILQSYDNFIGNDNIITELLELLLSEEILQLLSELV